MSKRKESEKLPAVSDEQIVAALISTGSIKKAAESLEISVKTIYARKTTDDFRGAYYAAQADLLRGAVISMNDKIAEAVDTIAEIMTDKTANPQTRLQAAQTLLNNAGKLEGALYSLEQKATNGFVNYHHWAEKSSEPVI